MSILESLAADAVKRAIDAGATDVECTIMEGEEFSAAVRMREIESLKEAGSRAAGIRVLVGKYGGSSYTSDLTPEGIATMVRGAIALAKITSEDPFAGLPDASDLGSRKEDLQLYDDAIEGMETDCTRSAPSASTANTRVRAESTPPDRPSTAPGNRCLST